MSFFCKQKTADEMRMSDWISDVCSSDLRLQAGVVVLEIKRTEHRLHLIVHLPQQLAARVGAANLAILVAARLVGEETLGPVVASGHTRRQLLIDQRCGEEAACGVVRRRATLAIAPLEAECGRASRRERVCKYVKTSGVA